MLTEDEVIADLSRLRERSAPIEYTGEVPLTRRSVAATVAPVAAVAAVATLGAAAVVGSGNDGSGAGAAADRSATAPEGGAPTSLRTGAATTGTIRLVSARLTLGGRTITYRHAPGEDPFGGGWQVAIDYGRSLPAGATRFDLGGGEVAWVADAADGGGSVLIVVAGPHDSYIGAPSTFDRADLEEFVRTSLHGH